MKALLTTLHAKYVHASLALPYLAAACGELEGVDVAIREFTINEPPDGILQQIIAEEADVVLFSCYIWNIDRILRLSADLKLVKPETCIVLGGPEASHGVFELLECNPAVDCIVRGEGETTCRLLLQRLASPIDSLDDLEGVVCRSGEDVVAPPERPSIASLDSIPSPFAAGLVDLKKPLVYYETSRGCPFSCAFCMSSLEGGVRSFSMERIKSDLGMLMTEGVRTVKLVDRTFNFDAARANEIWSFILGSNRQSRFHFEIAADLLTDANFELLKTVPPETFRFEIGIQSKDSVTLERVGRTSDLRRLYANVARLTQETLVTIHLDLVAGLPHEDLPGFLQSLQSLFQLHPHHIQVEPLKVLKGAPMRKIADNEGYAYSAAPPYKILRTPWLSYDEICQIEAICRLLDLLYNSGRFTTALAVLAEHASLAEIFHQAARFWQREGIPPQLAQAGLFEAFWHFGEELLSGRLRETFREALCYDFCLLDYPAAGKLPGFFAAQETGGAASKVKLGDIARKLQIGEGSKIRSFKWRFDHDFRSTPNLSRRVDLLFLYISSSGHGQQVQILEENPSL